LQEENTLASIYPTRVEFSADTGICYVYFAAFSDKPENEKLVEDALNHLKLYKPSLRAALAKKIPSRYTPDLVFLYDQVKEKERKINDLLDKVQEELKNVKDEDNT
jgi:ribosome-binding factor A